MSYKNCPQPYNITSLLDRIAELKAENARLQAIVDKLRNAELSQTRWEGSADIVLLNGNPTGATITGHCREFDRWWGAVKKELLAAEAAKETEHED